MRKVVINTCHGRFTLSEKALDKLSALKGRPVSESDYFSDKSRSDPDLVSVVEELGEESYDPFCSRLTIKEVEGLYYIKEFNGRESIKTPSDYPFV